MYYSEEEREWIDEVVKLLMKEGWTYSSAYENAEDSVGNRLEFTPAMWLKDMGY